MTDLELESCGDIFAAVPPACRRLEREKVDDSSDGKGKPSEDGIVTVIIFEGNHVGLFGHAKIDIFTILFEYRVSAFRISFSFAPQPYGGAMTGPYGPGVFRSRSELMAVGRIQISGLNLKAYNLEGRSKGKFHAETQRMIL